jgi:phage/plasmid-like protein (TIGR03299 family)
MSHGVEKNNRGEIESAYSRVSAWHRQMGLFVPNRALTPDEILKTIAFEVNKRNVYRFVPETLPEVGQPWPTPGPDQAGWFQTIDGRAETYRTDMGVTEYGSLGHVGEDYVTFQTRELLDTFCGFPIEFEAAFALFGGKQVVIVAKVVDGEHVLGDGQDRLLSYLVIRTSHDGSVPVEVMLSSFRPDCANMIAMASEEATKRGTVIRMKHTGNVQQRAREAALVLDRTNVQMAKHGEAAAKMLAMHLREEQFVAFLDEVMPLPSPVTKAGKGNPQFKRAVDARDMVKALYRNSPTMTRIRGTAWAAVNAVSEYVDHGRGIDDVATRSAVLGHGADTKRKAWREAVRLLETVS